MSFEDNMLRYSTQEDFEQSDEGFLLTGRGAFRVLFSEFYEDDSITPNMLETFGCAFAFDYTLEDTIDFLRRSGQDTAPKDLVARYALVLEYKNNSPPPDKVPFGTDGEERIVWINMENEGENNE